MGAGGGAGCDATGGGTIRERSAGTHAASVVIATSPSCGIHEDARRADATMTNDV
ncbi:Hypothetical protein A7982_02562 [Minicystis rosea]|nr:Hypothetical protein A7982_02562 [Minicystis rosea]